MVYSKDEHSGQLSNGGDAHAHSSVRSCKHNILRVKYFNRIYTSDSYNFLGPWLQIGQIRLFTNLRYALIFLFSRIHCISSENKWINNLTEYWHNVTETK